MLNTDKNVVRKIHWKTKGQLKWVACDLFLCVSQHPGVTVFFFSRLFQGLLLLCPSSTSQVVLDFWHYWFLPIFYHPCHHLGPKCHHPLPGILWYLLTGFVLPSFLLSCPLHPDYTSQKNLPCLKTFQWLVITPAVKSKLL